MSLCVFVVHPWFLSVNGYFFFLKGKSSAMGRMLEPTSALTPPLKKEQGDFSPEDQIIAVSESFRDSILVPSL